MILLSFSQLSSAQNKTFDTRTDCGVLENPDITEASGIACSIRNPGILWTHNDSGDKSRIFAVGYDGKDFGEYILKGIKARDWEDIAVGPGPVDGESYIYIGEIGDNFARHFTKYIYRFPEPLVTKKKKNTKVNKDKIDIISFQFPDGQRDAETVMIDPTTKDIYIVSKREKNVRVYKAPYPQSTAETIILEFVTSLDATNINGGDISHSGSGILLKTYTALYFWPRSTDEPFWNSLTRKPARLPYVIEPQGEAVCWNPEDTGYFTVSEKHGNTPVHLYFYSFPRDSFLSK